MAVALWMAQSVDSMSWLQTGQTNYHKTCLQHREALTEWEDQSITLDSLASTDLDRRDMNYV